MTSLGLRLPPFVRAFCVLGVAVFAASMLGLASRHAFSVSFWPANAVLVGCAIRDRRLFTAAGWAGALVGFMAADLLFGRSWSLAAFFAGANLIGALTATAVLYRFAGAHLSLHQAHSVPYLVACLLPGCLVAGLGGALLVAVEFGGSAAQALLTWPASELVNYLVVLPAMLTLCHGPEGRAPANRSGTAWPALLLAASCAAAVYFDGPGSIMFPMPALLLCALVYPMPVTAVLTMAMGTGSLVVLGLGMVDIGQNMAVPAMVVSVRVAVAFLVLVPLTISSVMAVHDDLLARLRQVADHDGLTGLLNRRTFEAQLQERFDTGAADGARWLLLSIDIDHFKAINDTHGHLAGDAVLQAFAAVARGCCGDQDLVGRLGGEEFAVLARVSGPAEAQDAADRLSRAFAAHTSWWNDAPIRATVSIGAAYLEVPVPSHADLSRRLDEALYRAKRSGRNRIEWIAEAQTGASMIGGRSRLGLAA